MLNRSVIEPSLTFVYRYHSFSAALFRFKLSLAIRGSNIFHIPTFLIGWPPLFPQFPLPTSQSSVATDRLHDLRRNPPIGTTDAINFGFHLPGQSVHGGTVKRRGKRARRFVCGLDKVGAIVLKHKLGRVAGKFPHGP